MLSKLYEMPSFYKAVPIDPSYLKLSQVDSVSNGVLVKRSEFKMSCVADAYSEFTIHDFCIGNILLTGATNMLRPVSFVNPDVAGVTIKMDNFLNPKDNEKAS